MLPVCAVSHLSSYSLRKRSVSIALFRPKEPKTTLLLRVPEPVQPTGRPQLPPLILNLIKVERVTQAEAEPVGAASVTQRLQQSTWRRAVTCSLLSRLYLLLPSYCSVWNVIVKSKIRVSYTIILSQISNKSKARDWNQNALSSMVLTLNSAHFPLGDFAFKIGHFKGCYLKKSLEC